MSGDFSPSIEQAVRTTTGSTNAVQSSPSSNKARTKETAAEASRIRTSWSLNCSRTSSHSGVGGSSGRALERAVSSRRWTRGFHGPQTILAKLGQLLLDARVRETRLLVDVEMAQDVLSRFDVGRLHGGVETGLEYCSAAQGRAQRGLVR